MQHVFISSTATVVLRDYSQGAWNVCLSLGLVPVMRSRNDITTAGATLRTNGELMPCDLYIGILGGDYGYREPGYRGKSVAEIEFDWAGERGLDRLCFVPGRADHVPEVAGSPADQEAMKAFLVKARSQTVIQRFTTVENFTASLSQSLGEWVDRHPNPYGTLRQRVMLAKQMASKPDFMRGGTWGYGEKNKEALQIAEAIGDRYAEVLINLTLADSNRGFNSMDGDEFAEPYWKQAKRIVQETGDLRSEQAYYASIGPPKDRLRVALQIGDRRSALLALHHDEEFYIRGATKIRRLDILDQHVALARELGDRDEEDSALAMRGQIQTGWQNYGEAIRIHQERLDTARKAHDRYIEAKALADLGATYTVMEQLERATDLFEQSAAAAREVEGDRSVEVHVLDELADLYRQTGQRSKLAQCSARKKDILREAGGLYVRAYGLKDLADASERHRQLYQALKYFEEARSLEHVRWGWNNWAERNIKRLDKKMSGCGPMLLQLVRIWH